MPWFDNEKELLYTLKKRVQSYYKAIQLSNDPNSEVNAHLVEYSKYQITRNQK